MGIHGENRRHPRVSAYFRVSYADHGTQCQCVTTNISASGMLLQGAQRLTRGQAVDFSMAVPSQALPMVFRGTVVAADDTGTRVKFNEEQHGMWRSLASLVNQARAITQSGDAQDIAGIAALHDALVQENTERMHEDIERARRMEKRPPHADAAASHFMDGRTPPIA